MSVFVNRTGNISYYFGSDPNIQLNSDEFNIPLYSTFELVCFIFDAKTKDMNELINWRKIINYLNQIGEKDVANILDHYRMFNDLKYKVGNNTNPNEGLRYEGYRSIGNFDFKEQIDIFFQEYILEIEDPLEIEDTVKQYNQYIVPAMKDIENLRSILFNN